MRADWCVQADIREGVLVIDYKYKVKWVTTADSNHMRGANLKARAKYVVDRDRLEDYECSYVGTPVEDNRPRVRYIQGLDLCASPHLCVLTGHEDKPFRLRVHAKAARQAGSVAKAVWAKAIMLSENHGELVRIGMTGSNLARETAELADMYVDWAARLTYQEVLSRHGARQ